MKPRTRSAHALALFASLACAGWHTARAGTPNEGDAARGKMLYEQRCSACHSPQSNRVGPRHAGVFGRRAGSVPDYEYSEALKRSALVWNELTLDAWLSNPQALVPGQRMGYSVPEARDRADLIAYLRGLKSP